VIKWLWRKKEKQLYRYEFPLVYPQGGSAGRVSAIATDKREARMMILMQLDPGKIIIGPAECMGPLA
jgi:hypothetical protein